MDINCILLLCAVVAVALILCLICWVFSTILNLFNFSFLANLLEVIVCILVCSIVLVGVIALIVFAFLSVVSAFFFLLIF